MANRTMLTNVSRVALLCTLATYAGAAFAAEFTLRAAAGSLTMPDGTEVPMWGFACEAAVAPAVCPNPGAVTVPGPPLVVPPGDDTLTINLTNELSAPVSIVIPGQAAAMAPVFTTDAQGRRRVVSFTREAPAGGSQQYVWNDLKPGTYLYHSGTHPQVQVQMGLYGAVTKSVAAGLAYDGVDYDLDDILLFSEIDPALHEAVAGPSPTYGTPAYPSTINYQPRYFLINGAPFTPDRACLGAGSTAGSRVLIRMLNAGLREFAPMILESHWDVVAEGGNPYRITTGTTSVPLAREQYSVLLPPGGTADVIFTGGAEGVYRIIDRRLNLTNSTEPDGGLQTCVAVGAVPPATGVTLTASVPSPQPAGTPVLFTASGEGSSSYQYRFWIKASDETNYTMVQDYGVGSTWEMPSTTPAGTYRVIVHVRTNSSGTFEAQAGLDYTLAPAATGVTLTASVPSPQPAGTPVLFTAAGEGASSYEYRFWIWNPDASQWVMTQDYGVGSSWTLPASTAAGTYRVVVHVRAESSTAFFEAQAGVDYTLVALPYATGVTLTPNIASPVSQGTPVVFTAAGEGSSGYQYRFWIWNPDASQWVMTQDYGVGSSWTMPASTAAGTYRVVVHVRAESSTAFFDAQAGVDYTIDPLPHATGVTVTPNIASPVSEGTPVVFTAAGEGSSAYEYRFWIWSPANPVWTMVQDYGVGASWTMPASTAAGTYRVVVHVRANASSWFEAQGGVDYIVNPLPLAAGVMPEQ